MLHRCNIDAFVVGLSYCLHLLLQRKHQIMSNPVTSAPKYADFGSNDALARALIKGYPKIDWGGQPRSLSAKIGVLDKSDVTWWLSRGEQTQALAELLEIPVEDLGVRARAASYQVAFPDFPALKPLDLKREPPWKIGQEVLDPSQAKSEYGRETLDQWLEPDPASWRPPYEFSWLQVNSDIERNLLTQKIAATGRFDVLAVPTLADAAEQLRGGKPLVVLVSASGGEADWYAMADRSASAGLLVISPFGAPVRDVTSSTGFYSWERQALRGRELRKFDLAAAGAMSDIKRWTWALTPDWRMELLTWVDARMSRDHTDTLFSAEDAQKWLNRFDPQSTWFSTPSGLLQLCQIMHSVPYTKLPRPSDKDGGLKLAKRLFHDGPAYRHTQMAQLACNRWESRGAAWNGSLPMDTWLSLSPGALVAVSPEALKNIARGKSLTGVRNDIQQLAESAELGSPDALLNGGLIHADPDGGYDFQRTTLAALLVRDKLLHQITHESVSNWGWACFDAHRRPLADAVLDAISIEQLFAISQRVLSESTASDTLDSAAIVGASEALFIAVSRRIADGESIQPAAFLPLAQVIVMRLDMASVEWALPEPLSRPMQTDDDRLRWITACWAWSLLPNTNTNAPTDSWLFPGWCTTLPEVPWWIGDLWYADKYEPAPPAWLRLLAVVDELLKDVDVPIANAPRALHVSLLSRAAAGQWLPELLWWEGVSQCFWAQDALIERLNALGAQEAPQVALRLWPSWLALERNFAAEKAFILVTSKVRRWLLEAMSAAEAIAILKDDDLWYLVGSPNALPPDFRPLLFQQFMPLLLAALDQNLKTVEWGKEVEFFERFGEGVAPLLQEFLIHERLGSAAATCLWRWDNYAAVQLLKNPQQLEAIARQHLLMTSPATHLIISLAALQSNPELFDLPYLASWARQHLPNSGGNAPALLLVLNAAEASPR